MIYFLTGIASIVLDANNLYEYNCPKMDLGFFAPISYCLFLYICIKPFGRIFRSDKIKTIYVRNERVIDLFIYFSFGIFLIITLVSFDRINDIILNSAFAEVRREAYMGDRVSFYDAYSGLPRYICALSTFFYPMTYLCIPLLFYNLVFRSKRWYYHIITILASSTSLVSSVLQADRSQFFYWMLLLGFSFTLFKGFFKPQLLRKVLFIMLPIIVGIIAYFVAVSVARWGEESSGGTIRYMGMNYFNYCNFVNNIWGAPKSLCEIFPFTYFILGKPSYPIAAEIVSKATHMTIAVFPTFLGLIFAISGPIVLLLYIIFFYFTSCNLLRRRSESVITLDKIIKMWIVALVPLLGVFGYFYMENNATLAIFFWLVFGYLTKKQIK